MVVVAVVVLCVVFLVEIFVSGARVIFSSRCLLADRGLVWYMDAAQRGSREGG